MLHCSQEASTGWTRNSWFGSMATRKIKPLGGHGTTLRGGTSESTIAVRERPAAEGRMFTFAGAPAAPAAREAAGSRRDRRAPSVACLVLVTGGPGRMVRSVDVVGRAS